MKRSGEILSVAAGKYVAMEWVVLQALGAALVI